MKYFLPGFLMLIIFSCKKENAETTTNPEKDTVKCNTFPLSSENYWVYNTTHYKPNGDIEVADTDTIRIEQSENFNGKTFYFFNPLWVRNKDCNTITAYDEETGTEFDVINNATKNDSLAKDIPYSTSPCKYGIKLFLNKDRTIIDSLSCYKVSYDITACTGVIESTHNLYFSEGVGFVKSELYQYTQNRTKYLHTKQELTSYYIKP